MITKCKVSIAGSGLSLQNTNLTFESDVKLRHLLVVYRVVGERVSLCTLFYERWKTQDGMSVGEFWTFLVVGVFCYLTPTNAYYRRIICYGTGDCIFAVQSGGHVDDQHRWSGECHDGEALVGFYDSGDYTSWGEQWCKFSFPRKPPSNGIYPYYEFCNVRNIRPMREYYCFDKRYPMDTYDTFVTAYAPGFTYRDDNDVETIQREMFKCCKLPPGYHLDYSRCEYKYTHDKTGEHYNEHSMFIAKCPRDFLMTGMGKAESPLDQAKHFVWIQCCPLFFDPAYITMVDLAKGNLLHKSELPASDEPSQKYPEYRDKFFDN